MELAILDFIQSNFRCGIMDSVMTFITGLGDSGKIWIACTILLLLIPKTRKAGLAMGIALALEIVCCNVILKPFVARIRPCDVNAAVLAGLIGFSRLYLYVHYPTDVLAGALIGIMMGWVGSVLANAISARLSEHGWNFINGHVA